MIHFVTACAVGHLSVPKGIALALSAFAPVSLHGSQRRRRAMFVEHLIYQRPQPRRGDTFFSAHMALLTELGSLFLPRLQTCRAYGTWRNQLRHVEFAPN
jgi:hypothetical protein